MLYGLNPPCRGAVHCAGGGEEAGQLFCSGIHLPVSPLTTWLLSTKSPSVDPVAWRGGVGSEVATSSVRCFLQLLMFLQTAVLVSAPVSPGLVSADCWGGVWEEEADLAGRSFSAGDISC